MHQHIGCLKAQLLHLAIQSECLLDRGQLGLFLKLPRNLPLRGLRRCQANHLLTNSLSLGRALEEIERHYPREHLLETRYVLSVHHVACKVQLDAGAG